MRIGEYETHPAADVFPLLEGARYEEFRADIEKRGQRIPVSLYQGKILDGRNRYRACLDLGIKPTFSVYEGDDPIAEVVSLNERRRHMSESQRGMVAGRIANLPHGGRMYATSDVPIATSLPQADAADLMDVSRQTVLRARVVLEKGIPEVIAAVDSGALAISAADPLARMPEETQRDVMKRAGGDSRKVRGLVREAGGDAPALVSASKKSDPGQAAEAPLTERQHASRKTDERIRELLGAGKNQSQIASEIGVNKSTVSKSLLRQGITKKAHPIQTIDRRARETARHVRASIFTRLAGCVLDTDEEGIAAVLRLRDLRRAS